MNPVSPAQRVLSPLRIPPFVLFRTECHDEKSDAYNSTFLNFNMVSRASRSPSGSNIPLTRKTFDDCLSWQKVDTPLIPFTRNWEKAMKRRRDLIKDKRKQIVIVAIWAKDLCNIYDASEVAELLGYKNNNRDKRRQLRNHNDEYLLHGDILADEYRILAIFKGEQEEDVTLSVPGLSGSTIKIPDAFIKDLPGTTSQEKLQNMIYMYTGIRGESAQLWYLIGFMIKAFDCPWTSFVVT